MTAFFLTTFVAILSMLTYQSVSGHHVDFALSYRRAGFPVGVAVMVLALGYLAFNWTRRMARKRRAA